MPVWKYLFVIIFETLIPMLTVNRTCTKIHLGHHQQYVAIVSLLMLLKKRPFFFVETTQCCLMLFVIISSGITINPTKQYNFIINASLLCKYFIDYHYISSSLNLCFISVQPYPVLTYFPLLQTQQSLLYYIQYQKINVM